MKREPTGQSYQVQALSLYVLLLAFFICLVRLSGADAVRAGAVSGSLDAAFRGEGRPSRTPDTVSSLAGTAPGDNASSPALGALIRTELDFGAVRDIVPGSVMEFEVATARLFAAADVAIDPLYRRKLERIAAALAGPPPGLRYDAEIALGVAGPASADDPAARLAVRRAAFLGTVLTGAGAPARTLATGIEPGAPDRLRMMFHVRPADEPPPFAQGKPR